MINRIFGSIIFVSVFVLSGCCDRKTTNPCREDAMSNAESKISHVQESAGVAEVMRLDVKETSNIRIVAELLQAACISGKGGKAKVKISWQAETLGLDTIRASVGTADTAEKIWMESGASGEGVTGPWIEDGGLIRLTDPKSGNILGEVRATALPCAGGKSK